MTEQTLAQAWFEQRNPDAFRGLCERHSGMVYELTRLEASHSRANYCVGCGCARCG